MKVLLLFPTRASKYIIYKVLGSKIKEQFSNSKSSYKIIHRSSILYIGRDENADKNLRNLGVGYIRKCLQSQSVTTAVK